MATNISEFISILQFSQMHLIFEINFKRNQKDGCKKLQKKINETSMWFNFFGAHKRLKLLAITL